MKSFLLGDLACCVAGGINWLPSIQNNPGDALTVIQAPVVWLDFDNGQRRTHDRFAALGHALKLPEDAPLYYYSMPEPKLDARNKAQMEILASIIESHSAKLVVIDNLGAISGGADENLAEMISVFGNLRWLSEKTGAAVVVIHHPRKANGYTSRKGEAIRGHSSIEAALDLALLVEREPDSKLITIQSTKTRGSDVEPFGAMFTYEEKDNGDLLEARFFAQATGNLAGNAKNKEERIMKAILKCLGDDTLNKTTLVSKARQELGYGIGGKRIRSTIASMVAQGYLNCANGDNNAQLYSRNPDKTL